MTTLGFNPDFLGNDYRIPYPTLLEDTAEVALNDGELYHYTHHTIVMNKKTRLAIYSACNVNLDKYIHISSDEGRKYHHDPRIEKKYQIEKIFYVNNPYDQGHLTRRTDVCWGDNKSESEKAEYDSNCWTNIAPQHNAFHASIWGDLEEWVRNKTNSIDGKYSIFTGPIHMENDRNYCIDAGCMTIPAGYYKIVFTVGSNHMLHVIGFIMKQDDFWNKHLGRDIHSLKSYQVSLSAITKVTNIKFDESLYLADPLNGVERDQQRVLITTAKDIII